MAGDRRELRTDFVSRDVSTGKTLKEIKEGADEAADAVDELGDQADQTGEKLDDLGQDAAQTAALLKSLDASADQAKRSIRELAREAASTGDLTLFKDLNRQKAELRKLGELRRILSDAGDDGAKGFSASFIARAGPLLARAPLSPHLVAAVAAAAPLVSSALAGAVTLGVSGGVVGGGLLVAAKDARVQAAARTLGNEVNNSLGASIRAHFVPEALAALSHVRAEYNRLGPDLERIFAKSARFVEPLTRAGVGAAEGLLDGVEAAVDRADPLFDMLEDRVPRIGAAVGQVIDDFSRSAESSADTLGGLLTLTEATLLTTGKTVGLLSEYSSLLGLGPLQILGDLTKDNSSATDEWANSFRDLVGSAHQAEAAVKSFAETANETVNANLSAAEANLRYKESIDKAKDAADGKRKVTSEEDAALLSLARSSNSLTEALDAQGRGALEAAAHNEKLRGDFVKAAMAAGYTKAQAIALADKYLAIPKNVNTKISADSHQAQENLKKVGELIAAIKSKKVVITTQHHTIVTRSEGRNVPIGDVGGRSEGGLIVGPGSGTSDDIVTRVSDGEYVLRAAAVRTLGVPFLEGLNNIDRIGRSSRTRAGMGDIQPRGGAGGGSWAGLDEDRIARAVARALSGVTLRIDDRNARLADLFVRGG